MLSSSLVNVSALKGLYMTVILCSGMKNGVTKIIREGDNGVAYSWNAKEYQWDKVFVQK